MANPVSAPVEIASSSVSACDPQAAQNKYYNDQLSRPRYTAEVKDRALKLVDEGMNYREVAKVIGSTCNCGTIGYWVKQRKEEQAAEASLKDYSEIQYERNLSQDLFRPEGHRMEDLGT